MISAPKKTALLAAALCAALSLSACGGSEETKLGINEGAYVDVGDVAYQVQISRILNPKSQEDPSYLVGVAPGQQKLGPNEQWFAVFLRAQNFGDHPLPVANKFVIRDANVPKENVYEPIPLDSKTNVFAWNPTQLLDPWFIYPDASSIAGTGPVRQGGELLFKIKNTVYQNRPLLLEIQDKNGKPQAAVSLDL
mgnify:CR=1 FL=1